MTTTTITLSDDATRQLGDWGCGWRDDYEGHSPTSYIPWLLRVERGQTRVANVHPEVRDFFEIVQLNRFDWHYDEQSGEEKSGYIDWKGIVITSKAAAEELRAIEWESDAQTAAFILDYITGRSF